MFHTAAGPTALVGIGMGLIDMGGGFDWFYEYLDNAENEHNNPKSVGGGW